MSVRIAIELGSTLEFEALEQALETHVELERDRVTDPHSGITQRDRQRLKAAEALLKRVRGER